MLSRAPWLGGDFAFRRGRPAVLSLEVERLPSAGLEFRVLPSALSADRFALVEQTSAGIERPNGSFRVRLSAAETSGLPEVAFWELSGPIKRSGRARTRRLVCGRLVASDETEATSCTVIPRRNP